MRFAMIADDDTGATDAAGMLTERGVRTCLVLHPSRPFDHRMLRRFDAVVFGTQARSVSPRIAYRRTFQAATLARDLGARKIQIKYCSTFDSTPRGNIGPSLDAAMDVMRTQQVIVCPALPVNGRTTYMGHHFVGRQLLSESPMRNHPLNPMTDPDLVRWLGSQTRRKVGLADLAMIRRGPRALRASLDELAAKQIAYVVTDAVCRQDIGITMRAVRDHVLVSGGSGLTMEIPAVVFPRRRRQNFTRRIAQLPPGLLVVSGSMSPSTRAQKDHAVRAGFTEIAIDAIDALKGKLDEDAILAAARKAHARDRGRGRGRCVIVHTCDRTAAEVHRAAHCMGLDDRRTGVRIGDVLANVARRLIGERLFGRLIVSGGETSGSVCRALRLEILEIGLPIHPGVPYCFPLNQPDLLLVLKSGNFGATDLYTTVRDL